MIRCGILVWILAWLGGRAWSESGALITVGAPWRYALLTGGLPPAGWMRPDFADDGWAVGPAGFSAGLYGYDEAATVLPTFVQGVAVRGLLMRHAWVVREVSTVETLTLRVDFEDGLVGWLNGEEIFRRGIPAGVPITGLEVPAPRLAGAVELIDLTPFRDRLVAGTNVLSLLVLDATVSSATLFAWPELRANFTRGPLVQNVSRDAATIFWWTAAPVSAEVVYEPVAGAGVAGAGGGEISRRLSAGLGTQGVVVLTGLTPGTTYEYRVEWEGSAGRVTSEPARFTTFRDSGDVDFLVLGDSGSGSAAQHAVASAMAKEATDLVLHTGDISYPVFEDGQVDLRCLSAYEAQMRGVPFFFTVGNHDFYDGDAAYRAAFWLPTNTVTGTEHYYSFDHGDAHFVSLFVPWHGVSQLGTVQADGGRSAPYRWLTNDLAQTRKPWKIVFFHQPIRTSGPHVLDDYDVNGRPDIEELREALLPALSGAGVQMVFMGHDHAWERFAPTNGVHGVVTGGGGAVLYPLYRRDAGSGQFVYRHHHARVRIRGVEMVVEAVDPMGAVLDRFSVRRSGPEGMPARWGSTWRLAASEPGLGRETVWNGDGNAVGETFDLTGDGVLGMPGRAANPGRLVVDHDGWRIRLGLRDAMLWPGQTLLLFLGAPGLSGVTHCAGVGMERGHPLAGLDLGFAAFRPGWVCLLGDERADGTFPGFRRAGDPVALGQGVFRMDAGLTVVEVAGVRQFNRSPEGYGVVGEENADFMVVTLPRALLGVERVGATLAVGAVVVTPVLGVGGVRLEPDTAFLGTGLGRDEAGGWRLEPIEISLADVPVVDRDGDGLVEDQEAHWGTDPDHPDSDGDGLPDGWEVVHGLNPRVAAGEDGGEGDADGDGYSNREEFGSGTSPREPEAGLRIQAVREGGRLQLVWRAMIGRVYDVEVATGLPGRFESAQVPGFPRRAVATNDGVRLEAPMPGAGARWYRIREEPAR